jgi:plastocyanin
MSAAVKVIVALVVLAALGSSGYALFHKSSPNTTTSRTDSTSTQTSKRSQAPASATITFSDSGFSPSVTTVKAGDTVRVTNKSSQELDFDSDPHPEHTDEPELNVGPVSPGESKTFIVTRTGHWGFHDHLNPGFTGTLNVD